VLPCDQAGTDRGNALKTTKSIASFDADAKRGLSALARNSACNGKLATMGVCLGGCLAYRAALDPSVSAAACFYATDIHSGTLGAGKADGSLARMDELRAETLFVWGCQDPHVPFAGRQAIRARLGVVNARYEWHEVNVLVRRPFPPQYRRKPAGPGLRRGKPCFECLGVLQKMSAR
jgi:carboxymethylenebutenolidase